VTNRYRQLFIICSAIAMSLVMVNVLLVILQVSGPLPPKTSLPRAVPLGIFAVSVVILMSAPAVQRAILKRYEAEGEPEALAAGYSTALIVAFALRETAGLLGFILALLTGNPWWSWGLGGAALLAMVMDRPRRAMLE
jgi:hypothetical protein